MVSIMLDKYNRLIEVLNATELDMMRYDILGFVRTQTISYRDVVVMIWKTPKWSKKEVFDIIGR